jgi:hypothetical protein
MIILAGPGSGSFLYDVCILKPDGRVFRIGQRGRTWAGVGWSFDDVLCLQSSNATPAISRMIAPPLIELDKRNQSGIIDFAVMVDRYLVFDGNLVVATTIPGNVTSTEKIITVGEPAGGRIYPYDLTNGKQLWWLTNTGSGKVYLYDAVAKIELSSYRTTFGAAVDFAAYSRKWNVFATILARQVTIFANEPKASSITVPQFIPVPSAGKQSVVSAQVLGSFLEPCVKRQVTFTAGNGAFPITNTTVATVDTDSSGVASILWNAPYDPQGAKNMVATLVE